MSCLVEADQGRKGLGQRGSERSCNGSKGKERKGKKKRRAEREEQYWQTTR